MTKWFATKREAEKEKKRRDPDGFWDVHVYKWRHTKRKRPYFVGTQLEWLNAA